MIQACETILDGGWPQNDEEYEQAQAEVDQLVRESRDRRVGAVETPEATVWRVQSGTDRPI